MSRLIHWAITLVIVALLVVFARNVDWSAAWAAIRGASPSLLAAAFLVNALSQLLRGVRWWVFLRAAGARSLWLAIRAAIAGAALNNLVLAQGGEAARVVFVSRASGVPSARVLATLALERLFDAVGFVILLVIATFAFPLPPALDRWRIPAAGALVVVIVVLGALVYIARRPVEEAIVEALAPTSAFGRFRRYVGNFASSARELATGGRFSIALIISMLAWLGQLLTYHWCAVATGISLPVVASLAALLAGNLGFLVRATPGSVGVFQVIYAVTVAQFGVDRNAAIAASLLIQTLQIIPLTIVGVALAPEFVFKKRQART
jgi:uncharacterized protein (TIRG00374 family)